MTCTATMVSISLWVGFTLPGMIDEPGSFSGKPQLAQAGARAGAEPADVVRDLHEARGERLQGAGREDRRLLAGERRELVRRGRERDARELGDAGRGPCRELRVGVEPGADGGPAEGDLVEAGEHRAEAGDVAVEHGDVARELLAERERHRVLEVRPPDLDDPRPGACLGVEGVAQRGDRRQQAQLGAPSATATWSAVGNVSFDDWLMFTWSFGWIGALPPRTPRRQLVGAPGDHLVHVHVRLGARAGLPDAERELGRQRPVDDLAGSADDQVAAVRREEAEVRVDLGGGTLEDPERVDDRDGHRVACRSRSGGASAGSGRPSSGRPAPRSAPSSRSRCACRSPASGAGGDRRRSSRGPRLRRSRLQRKPGGRSPVRRPDVAPGGCAHSHLVPDIVRGSPWLYSGIGR